MSDSSIVRFRGVIEAGLAALEAQREQVNALNVFPVADHDTGDNMVLTLRAVVQELDRLAGDSGGSPVADVDREDIVASVARAALLGARGSSGVIVSQLVRGAAEELASRPGELVDPVLICAAMARAADQAYGSVRTPTEGTMLTVVREMTARMASELAHMREARLPAQASALEQNAVIAELVERALQAGRESMQRGPELLPALREAGVVDAGAYGLVVMLSGIVGALRGAAPVPLEHAAGARATQPQHFSTTYRYCVNFVVTGTGLEVRRYVPELEALGDAVLVVGDATTLRVHLHTDDPDAATALFDSAGAVSLLDIADMRRPGSGDTVRALGGSPPQAMSEERVTRTPTEEVSGMVAVASGPGIRSLFESLGARVLDGAPARDGRDGDSSSSPSPYDLLAAVHATDAGEVVVLPNSTEALRAARRAAALSEKTVCVVDSRSYQAGLAAAAVMDPGRDARANAEHMERTIEHITTGWVAPAAADDLGGRFCAGDAVGFVGEVLVAWGQPREALRAVLERLADGAELITCLRGADAPLDDRTVETLAAGEVEFELSEGGQAGVWWLLAAE
ncbi:MAG: DAK2 domain-containing protein [Solirubrobacterales bacterium]|nr:DAK2 domain-containing protein [Solirubrobacterales bacterium]